MFYIDEYFNPNTELVKYITPILSSVYTYRKLCEHTNDDFISHWLINTEDVFCNMTEYMSDFCDRVNEFYPNISNEEYYKINHWDIFTTLSKIIPSTFDNKFSVVSEYVYFDGVIGGWKDIITCHYAGIKSSLSIIQDLEELFWKQLKDKNVDRHNTVTYKICEYLKQYINILEETYNMNIKRKN